MSKDKLYMVLFLVLTLAFSFWLAFASTGCVTPDIPDWPPITVPHTTTTTTIPPIAENPNYPEFVHVAGGNVRFSTLNVSAQLAVSISKAGCRYTLTEDKDKWDKADGRSNGYICLIWVNPFTGAVNGEYWDGCVNAELTPYTAGWKHTQDATSPFAGRLPKSGQRIGIVKISLDKTQRSNVAEGVWPL